MRRNPEILSTETPGLFQAAVARAAELLEAGELVVLPTETVYGLAANAFQPEMVAKIFESKGRPAHNPIIVHVDGLAMARSCVKEWPDTAQKLADAFWPGPLTLVLPRSTKIPDIVVAGGETVGIRWPGHPLIREVIRRCGFPLAAPSANVSNQLSPTNAGHVAKGLGGKVKLIVDGGQSQIGIESTVVDLTVVPAIILRPGIIHEESLEAVLGPGNVGVRTIGDGEDSSSLKSPGQMLKHYSPRARLEIVVWNSEAELNEKLETAGVKRKQCWVLAHTEIPVGLEGVQVCVLPHDPEAYARALYAELHRCDEEGAKLIVVETVPDSAEWRGIADRLNRAAARE